MNKEYVKELLIKSAWAALYGAIAELALTQEFNRNTIWFALGSAVVRGVIVFAITIKENIKPATAVKGIKPKTWKSNL